MEKIDLLKQVQSTDGDVYEVMSIKVRDIKTNTIGDVPYINFIDKYQNYVDPKDAEIARLKAIIDELQNPIKERKHRKRLLPDEWKEIKELIRKGISNGDIAREYEISDSAVSKKRIAMREMGEKV